MLYRLRRKLADVLAPEPEPPAPPAAPSVPSPGKGSSFEDQLRRMLGQAGGKGLSAGRVHFIGLDKVKRRFGASWEGIAADADRIARHVIESHLELGDIYEGLQGFAYVMVFARSSQEQTRAKCLAIAGEITRRLLSGAGAEMLEIRTAVARLDGTIALEPISLVDAVRSAFAAAAPPEVPARAAPPPPDGATRRPGVKRSDRELLDHVDFAYRPIWDTAHEVVASYCCTAQVPVPDDGSAKADVAAMIGGDRGLAQLDQMVQERVLEDLDALVRDGRQALLAMPVHFVTLAQVASRRDFIHGLGGVSDAMRKLLLVEIDGVPEGVQKSLLAEIMLRLRGHCRAMMLTVPLETGDFNNLVGSGAFAIATDLSAHVGEELAVTQWMNHFAEGAKRAGIPTCALGLGSLSRVAAAVGAGFAYVEGDAVAKPVDQPLGVVKFSLGDVYRPLQPNPDAG